MKKIRNYKGKTALITGAASGIGREVARQLFVDEGCNLLIADMNDLALQDFKAELNALGQKNTVQSHVLDVTYDKAVQALARKIKGPLDLLINNAGIAHSGALESIDFAIFRKVVEVNLLGLACVAHSFMPHLLQAPNSTLVNIASSAGLMPVGGMSGYTASKYGAVGFSEAMRIELSDRVHVCTICPTFVRTNIARDALCANNLSAIEKKERSTMMDGLIQKIGTSPEKVAKIIIKSAKNRATLVPINPDAHMIYFMERMFPQLSRFLGAKGYRKTVDKGLA